MRPVELRARGEGAPACRCDDDGQVDTGFRRAPHLNLGLPSLDRWEFATDSSRDACCFVNNGRPSRGERGSMQYSPVSCLHFASLETGSWAQGIWA